jgi:uncharacterized damage-inducible protein DinB
MNLRTTRPTAAECTPYYHTYIQLVPNGDIVNILQTQHQQIHDLLKGMSEDKATASSAAGEWSTKQVLQHLIDAERLFAFRSLWFARGEQSPLQGMQPETWVAITDANARTLADLLAEFNQVRMTTVAFFEYLKDAAWLRSGSASGNLVSVRALAWIIAGHELHHNLSLR